MLNLQLRVSSELPASPAQPSPLPNASMATPGPGWRTVGRLRGASSTAEEIAEILQQAKEVRWAALPRHAGSGRAPTARRLHVTYNPVPPPPTPFVPTPAAPAPASPWPMTPAAALIQSLLRESPRRSASCGSPMEGVPERNGPLLQPKTPAFVYTPMEGVPERMGAMCHSSGKRKLHGVEAGDTDSPIEGILGQQARQGSNTTAKASGSKSSSFAFSRAGLAVTPGVESCPEDAQAAHVHPLGFFAPEGVRQLCHVEDVRMLDGAPKTPWRLRDYDPSPQMQPAPKRARHSAAAPSGLQPAAQEPPLAAFEPSPGPGASAAAAPVPAGDEQMNAVPESMQVDQDYGGDYRDDHGNDDDDDFGGNDAGWGDDGGYDDDEHEGDADMVHDEAHEEPPAASMAPLDTENQQPNSASLPSQAQSKAAAKGKGSRRRPTSSNKRLRREFQSRKSLAGDGFQAEGSLRRSTRRSIKPLDWWRNEKAIYERKFKSLPTVDDYERMPTTPNWTFVSDYRKKPQHR